MTVPVEVRERLAELKRNRQILVRHLQHAAGEVAPAWQKTPTGLVYRTDAGYGQIVTVDPWRDPEGMAQVKMIAGSASKYLLKVVNQQNPDKAPNRNFVAAHAQVLLNYQIRYSTELRPAPDVFVFRGAGHGYDQDLPPYSSKIGFAQHRTLSPPTAGEWLSGLLTQITPVVERTSTDEGLLEWLLARDVPGRYPDVSNMRYAVLLARHLGEPYSHLLDRAEALEESQDALRLAEWPNLALHHDRSTQRPQDWSHRRFKRYLDSLED